MEKKKRFKDWLAKYYPDVAAIPDVNKVKPIINEPMENVGNVPAEVSKSESYAGLACNTASSERVNVMNEISTLSATVRELKDVLASGQSKIGTNGGGGYPLTSFNSDFSFTISDAESRQLISDTISDCTRKIKELVAKI